MSWQKRIKHENNTSYSNKSNWNKYTLYCGNIINQLNTIYQQHMDIDITILQKNKCKYYSGTTSWKKTGGKAALFPPWRKVSKPIACVQGKRLRSKCLAFPSNPEVSWWEWVGGGRGYADFFKPGGYSGYDAFWWGSQERKQLNWIIWGPELEV